MEIYKDIKIRRYSAIDYPKLLELMRSSFSKEIYEKKIKRFKWQFEENPHNVPPKSLILILENNNTIIGMITATAHNFKINDKESPSYWLGDFLVHPDYRYSNYGLRIARAMTSEPLLMMGFPSEETIKIWYRVGYKKFSHLVEYSRATRPDFINHLKNKELKKCASFLYLLISHIKNTFCFKKQKSIKILTIKSFDERFNRLWERISSQYAIIGIRNSLFLNWRFFQCPHLSYHVLAAEKENEILGYIVMRCEDTNGVKEGHIVDIFVDLSNNKAITALIHAGILDLKTRGCDIIKISISSEYKILKDTLIENLFSVSVKEIKTVLYNNTGNDFNSALDESNNWFLTKADSDIDYS